jgi:hypothetical protein
MLVRTLMNLGDPYSAKLAMCKRGAHMWFAFVNNQFALIYIGTQ